MFIITKTFTDDEGHLFTKVNPKQYSTPGEAYDAMREDYLNELNLKVKEHHPPYRNMNRNYPGSVFLVGNQVHVMQGIAGSKDGEATTYKDTNANSIAAGKCKFVAKNSGILFV